MEEKRRSVAFGAIHCFGSRKEKKNQGLELSYLLVWNFCMDTYLGLCMKSMDLLVRKPS